MFDFCKLDVYQKAKVFCILIKKTISSGNFDKTTKDQLRSWKVSLSPKLYRFLGFLPQTTNLKRYRLILMDSDFKIDFNCIILIISFLNDRTK